MPMRHADAILEREAQILVDLGARRVGVEMNRVEPACQYFGEVSSSRLQVNPITKSLPNEVPLYLTGDNSQVGIYSGIGRRSAVNFGLPSLQNRPLPRKSPEFNVHSSLSTPRHTRK